MKNLIVLVLSVAILFSPAPTITKDKWCKRNPERCLIIQPDRCTGIGGDKNFCKKPQR